MERPIELFKRIANTSDEDLDFMISLLERVEFKKNDILLQQGEVERYLYFLSEGILRCFITKEREGKIKETTFNFVFAGSLYSSYHSFVTREPCKFSTQCLTDAELYRVSYENVQRIYKETESGERVGRISAEHLFMIKYRREISLLTETVDERYLYLVENYPHFLQKIPLKYLASYIGVTPQALSNIRKRVYKRK